MSRQNLDIYTNASFDATQLTKQIAVLMRILRNTDVAITLLTEEELSYVKALKHQCYKTLGNNAK